MGFDIGPKLGCTWEFSFGLKSSGLEMGNHIKVDLLQPEVNGNDQSFLPVMIETCFCRRSEI
jgi:hypothetical protein